MADSIATPVTVMFGGKAPKKAAAKKPRAAAVPAPMGPSGYKEPTHAERMHSAAADEHVHATRDYVAGRISSKQYGKVASRARKVMSCTKPSR